MIARVSKLLRNRWSVLALLFASPACSQSDNPVEPTDPGGPQFSCSISEDEIVSGGPGKDGIPALTNPTTAPPGGPGTEYLRADDRVIGLELGDVVLAIPHNILWWHEIVNLDVAGRRLAVTHCPLTGSSMVFDRAAVDGAELGVSGLLLRNNLIMYDRNTNESLWPQMSRRARCGAREGVELEMVPALEMTWSGWQRLHPDTRVVTSQTDYPRNYQLYPYDDYDDVDNENLLFPLPRIDDRRPPKERTLGIPDGIGGRAYPFGALEELGFEAVVDGEEHVIFWESQRQAAMAYSKFLDGDTLDFEADRGQIRDIQTGTVWRIDGVAVTGPLSGKRLEPIPEAFVSYWFAWAAFQPDAALWEAP